MRAGECSAVAARCSRRQCSRDASAGFTYLAVLLLVALIGLGLAAGAGVWASAVQREREAELLFIGNQYRQAIASYYERTPGGARRYPTALAQLLDDERFPSIMRHLRKLYPDPMTGKLDWTLLKRPDGQIIGVASTSMATPMKVDNFVHPLDRGFVRALALSDWKFVHALGVEATSSRSGSSFPWASPQGGAAPTLPPSAGR